MVEYRWLRELATTYTELAFIPSCYTTPGDTTLAASLPSLKPRLYSIASSPRVRPAEVHLCVGVPREILRGRMRLGVASHFRLPSDPSRAIIMCGPGTGIAPMRAFLQERAAWGRHGPGLFCGAQHRRRLFCNRDELLDWRKTGTLSRLDTAFSRDQANKIYVQDRMLENAADLWRWLQDGAYFYVWGDTLRMAKDVDAALPGRRRCFRAGRTLLVYHAYIQNGRLCMGSASRVV